MKLTSSNVSASPAAAGSGSAWMPGLTVRSVFASLLAMLIVALAIQMSTVDAGMESAGEYGLPIPGVVVLVVLVVLVGVAAKFLKWQLLTRAEMMAVFYCMVIAAPSMTQGFWHRVLSITTTIPRGADFKKMEFFSDRLCPHGPNVLKGASNGPVILEGTANINVVSKVVRVQVSEDAGGGIVPGEPYLVSFEAHAEGPGAEAFYFVRSRVPGRKNFQEALRSRELAKVDRLNPDGFVQAGAYGVIFTDLDGATEVEVEFGLAGVGRLEIRDPRLLNVSALELAYTGQQVLPAGEYDQLALADRAGLRRKPENLFSPEGFVFLLQAGIPMREWVTPLATWGGGGNPEFHGSLSQQGSAHGTSSVAMANAALLAKAGSIFDTSAWKRLADQQIQWTVGLNPHNRSRYTGIGYRQPVAYGCRVTQIPEGTVIGFIGRPDNTPYLEESFAIERNTLEHWDVPYAYAALAICRLAPFDNNNHAHLI